jgi:hypothetical protein
MWSSFEDMKIMDGNADKPRTWPRQMIGKSFPSTARSTPARLTHKEAFQPAVQHARDLPQCPHPYVGVAPFEFGPTLSRTPPGEPCRLSLGQRKLQSSLTDELCAEQGPLHGDFVTAQPVQTLAGVLTSKGLHFWGSRPGHRAKPA